MANTTDTNLLQNLIWYLDPVVLFATACGIWLRQRRSSYRFFFFYLLLVGANSFIALPITHFYGYQSWPYFYFYYVSNYSAIGLSFFVLYEVLSNVLTSGTWTISQSSFLLTTVILLVAATGVTVMIGHQYHSLAILNSLLRIEVCLRYVQIAVLVILAVLTFFFGFYWVDLAFGIALGFAFYAAMSIVNSEIFARVGNTYTQRRIEVDVIAYLVSSFIWLFWAWKRPKPGSPNLPSDKLSGYSEEIGKLIK